MVIAWNILHAFCWGLRTWATDKGHAAGEEVTAHDCPNSSLSCRKRRFTSSGVWSFAFSNMARCNPVSYSRKQGNKMGDWCPFGGTLCDKARQGSFPFFFFRDKPKLALRPIFSETTLSVCAAAADFVALFFSWGSQ